MPYTKEEGLQILLDCVNTEKKHRDYDHVVKLAEKYHQLITGDGIEKLMRQFSRREDNTLFTQRKDITQHITPSVASAIMSPFFKVGRVNVIRRDIGFESTEQFDVKKKIVEEGINNYFGDKSLDKYLETRFVELSFSDPNSFIVTEYDAAPTDDAGNPTEKVKPFPWEVSSEQAVNFKYKNYRLEWLVVKSDCNIKQTYTSGEGDKKQTKTEDEVGTEYTIYLENEAIKFTQIPFESVQVPEDGIIRTVQVIVDGQMVSVDYVRFDQKRVYRIDYFIHNAGRVPAIRIGYKRDLLTKGRTYVSPMEAGVPYFMKMIKTVSEFDLTMCLHVFPQKIQYVPRCTGESKEIGCDGGRNPSGNVCKICSGTGQLPAHTSAQDALFLRQPKDPADMIDLEKMMIYKSPPIELVKFQREYIWSLVLDAQKAVFNSDVFSRAEISATATEKFIELDNVYDTLFPFAEKFADIWKYVGKVIAALRDIDPKDILLEYVFPKDFKFKSVNDLLDELKKANDSSAPAYIKQEISRDIANQQFQDKPEELKRIYIKEKFFPFSGKSSSEIIYIISNEKTTKFNEILWSNFEQIFLELETDAEVERKYFYDYEFKLQKQKLDDKVNAMIKAIESSETAPAAPFTEPA